tara:strand:+ start:479 stop:1102 length:624 start_codon:yes stop_codon:yes gene_type:complete
MVYNNFFLRLLFSLIFISTYLICLYISIELVFYIILIIYLLVFLEILIYFKKYKLLPIIYILISFIFFMTMDIKNENYLSFNLFIIIIITFDIFSYIFGKYLGKKKLIKISPNKTYEGLLGGILMSLIFSLFFSYLSDIIINQLLISYISLIILCAFIGDLIESFFKRKNDLKNSSELIPGHGGVFDRFDSFLFSIIFYSIFYNFLI